MQLTNCMLQRRQLKRLGLLPRRRKGVGVGVVHSILTPPICVMPFTFPTLHRPTLSLKVEFSFSIAVYFLTNHIRTQCLLLLKRENKTVLTFSTEMENFSIYNLICPIK